MARQFVRYLFVMVLAGLTIATAGTELHALEPESRAPGLVEEVFQPFPEENTFPLPVLIKLHPDAELDTFRGRCLTFEIAGRTAQSSCEGRSTLTFEHGDIVTHWFTTKDEAIGLSGLWVPDKQEIPTIFAVNKVYRVTKSGQATEVRALGSCYDRDFYTTCQAIWPEGRADIKFATLGGPMTMQYPVTDKLYRLQNAVAYSAHGQCLYYEPNGGDLTPYCANYIGRAVLGSEAVVTLFSTDKHRALGFYGPLSFYKYEAGGVVVATITSIIAYEGKDMKIARAKGSCRETADEGGAITIQCDVTSPQLGSIQVGFHAFEALSKAPPPKKE